MFLAILSHDFAILLNSIGMTAIWCRSSGKTPPRPLHVATRSCGSVSVMERMIADLLDYTRIGSCRDARQTRTIRPWKPCCGADLRNSAPAHPNRDIQYRIDGDSNGRWDSDRIRQAISNLLGNAIQHGSADFPVTLSLRGETSSVFIDVHSGGDPIPPGELSKIFDPLIRGSSAAEGPTKNRTGSIGMGLYIAREVAKSHGGRITVTSTANEGNLVQYRSATRSRAERRAADIRCGTHRAHVRGHDLDC